MDIDLVSPLSIEECQKRLDAALVQYSVQLPLWNWPPHKMTGLRSGFGFTLDPRMIQSYPRPMTSLTTYGIMPNPVPFFGTLSESNGVTHIHGSFDKEATRSFVKKARIGFSLLLIAAFAQLYLSFIALGDNGHTMGALAIIVVIPLSWMYFEKNPYGSRKVRKFLTLILSAKEPAIS